MTLVYPVFKINGHEIPYPTTHRWIQPAIRGEDGYGNVRHESFWSYEIKWDFLTQEEFYSGVLRIFMGHYTSGAAVAELPAHDLYGYQFQGYSGTVLDYPMTGEFYQNAVKDVTLTIKKIKVY